MLAREGILPVGRHQEVVSVYGPVPVENQVSEERPALGPRKPSFDVFGVHLDREAAAQLDSRLRCRLHASQA